MKESQREEDQTQLETEIDEMRDDEPDEPFCTEFVRLSIQTLLLVHQIVDWLATPLQNKTLNRRGSLTVHAFARAINILGLR